VRSPDDKLVAIVAICSAASQIFPIEKERASRWLVCAAFARTQLNSGFCAENARGLFGLSRRNFEDSARQIVPQNADIFDSRANAIAAASLFNWCSERLALFFSCFDDSIIASFAALEFGFFPVKRVCEKLMAPKDVSMLVNLLEMQYQHNAHWIFDARKLFYSQFAFELCESVSIEAEA